VVLLLNCLTRAAKHGGQVDEFWQAIKHINGTTGVEDVCGGLQLFIDLAVRTVIGVGELEKNK
jgi:hypothetical protein